MTVQDLIDELNKVADKTIEIKAQDRDYGLWDIDSGGNQTWFDDNEQEISRLDCHSDKEFKKKIKELGFEKVYLLDNTIRP